MNDVGSEFKANIYKYIYSHNSRRPMVPLFLAPAVGLRGPTGPLLGGTSATQKKTHLGEHATFK